MKVKITPKMVIQFKKDICKHFGTKIIYTDTWIGRIYKRLVAIPFIKKALKKIGLKDDPKDWLDNRIITIGKYIFMPYRLGKTSNQKVLFNQIKILAHEQVHKQQQNKEGKLDFYVKYLENEGLRANFELEAIKTEMFLIVWNDYPIGTVDSWIDNLNKIYGFSNSTLKAIEASLNIIIKEYHRHGLTKLSSEVAQYSTKLLQNYKYDNIILSR